MASGTERQRLRIAIRGAVQGVGFRPFLYRLASEQNLDGWVRNNIEGVEVEAEGIRSALDAFLLDIERRRPPRSSIHGLEFFFLPLVGHAGFSILESELNGLRPTVVLPDIATCGDCLREIFNPADRRYRYPFTNCTNCGPRYSIIESLPYDRANTTMREFRMCEACAEEYGNPADRRFHAQPNACPECGPSLKFIDATGALLAERHEALLRAAETLRQGGIVAMKGIGGFLLLADARNDETLQRLRARKRRDEKPFALLFPDLDSLRFESDVSPLEERLLLSPESPIVLLRRRKNAAGTNCLSPLIAPGNPMVGALLPYSPLHHILMAELRFPVVATSGNLSDEPICTDEREALTRLNGFADFFLVHNRPIARHVDDSVARILLGNPQVLRRARGYAPMPLSLALGGPAVIATGAHLKNTVALAANGLVFASPHIGDLETPEALQAHERVVEDLCRLHGVEPAAVAHDSHPDYASTTAALRIAEARGIPALAVQHHHAHALACLAENGLEFPALAVVWDGSGHGLDGTVWGGEFLLVRADGSCERKARLRTFPLPGGDAAAREPRRSALGVLYEMWGERAFQKEGVPSLQAFSPGDLRVVKTMLEKEINTPRTSSAGRLFDAVASLLGIRQVNNFEGQAAMDLEFAAAEEDGNTPDIPVGEAFDIDWCPLVMRLLDEMQRGEIAGRLAGRFHTAMARIIAAMADRCGIERVALSGGCFQNRILTEQTVRLLRERGFVPVLHQRVPPNDGGIAYGQAVAVALRLTSQEGG